MAITEGITGRGGSGGTADTFVTLAVTGSPTVGNILVMTVAIQDTTVDVASISSDFGIPTWSRSADVFATGLRQQTWVSGVVTATGGSFAKVNLSGSSLCAAKMTEWAGVAALGTVASTTGSGANPSIAVTTQDSNNYVVGGFTSVGSTIPTAGTGTFDNGWTSSGSSPVTATMTNNTVASPGSVTNSVTLAATTWIAVGLELRTTVPTGSARPTLTLLGIGS